MKDYIVYIDSENVGIRRAPNVDMVLAGFHYTELRVVNEEQLSKGVWRLELEKVG
jgi:hypothetical protein